MVLLQIAFMNRFEPALRHLRWVGMGQDEFTKLGIDSPATERTAKKTYELSQSEDVGDVFSVLFTASNTKLFFVPEVMLTPKIIGNLHDN